MCKIRNILTSCVFLQKKRNESFIKLTTMKTIKILRPLAYSCLILLGCLSGTQAQQPQIKARQASLAVSPASVDAKVKRGASYTQNFTLTNSTGTRLKFRCSVGDFWYDENNKRLTGRAGTLPRSASLWLQFSSEEVIIEPFSSAVVKAVITVPPGVSGSFYTVPTFEGMPVDKPPVVSANENSTASIGIRFRGVMMLTTDEGAEYNVEIMKGQITPPTAASELEINLDLRNRGSAHAKVRGAFAILNSSGTLVGRGNIEEKRFLPTQRDRLNNKWSGELSPGNYTGVITLSYNRVGLEPTSLVYEIPFTVK